MLHDQSPGRRVLGALEIQAELRRQLPRQVDRRQAAQGPRPLAQTRPVQLVQSPQTHGTPLGGVMLVLDGGDLALEQVARSIDRDGQGDAQRQARQGIGRRVGEDQFGHGGRVQGLANKGGDGVSRERRVQRRAGQTGRQGPVAEDRTHAIAPSTVASDGRVMVVPSGMFSGSSMPLMAAKPAQRPGSP